MMLPFYVENRIPNDGGSKSIGQLYIDHIAVNKLGFGNYSPGNFQHLLRLVNANYKQAFFHDVFGNRVASATAQIKNFGSWWQTFKGQVNVSQNSIDVGLTP